MRLKQRLLLEIFVLKSYKIVAELNGFLRCKINAGGLGWALFETNNTAALHTRFRA